MNVMNAIRREFDVVLNEFEHSPAIRRVLSGEITLAHYKAYLRQLFHHTRENPQIQAFATVHFRGRQRTAVKKFYAHASSEVGHDQLALNDLAVLGDDVSQIPFEQPLPATTALLAYPFYQISNLNVAGYLGYLFFLEFTPTSRAEAYMQRLKQKGVPEEAMTFLHDHGTIDVGHNKMMESYVEEIITSEDDLAWVIYALKVTGVLYGNMVAAAFEQADRPRDWGLSPSEKRFSKKDDILTRSTELTSSSKK